MTVLPAVESRILRLFDFGLACKRLFMLYLRCRLSGSNSVGRMPASQAGSDVTGTTAKRESLPSTHCRFLPIFHDLDSTRVPCHEATEPFPASVLTPKSAHKIVPRKPESRRPSWSRQRVGATDW